MDKKCAIWQTCTIMKETQSTPIAQNQILRTLLARLPELNNIVSHHIGGIMALILAVCMHFNFQDPKEENQQQTTYNALKVIHEKGLIDLGDLYEPNPSDRAPKVLDKEALGRLPDNFDLNEALNSVRIVCVRDKEELHVWNTVIAYYHPLGNALVGRQIKYVFYIGNVAIGAIGFASPARNMQVREDWIKWSTEERFNYLHYIIYLARFAICDELKDCEVMKSKLLDMTLQSISEDFYSRYNYYPFLIETFAENDCVLANGCFSNWEFIGLTKGRGRYKTPHSEKKEIKKILMYPLVPDFRIQLDLEAVRPLSISEGLSLSKKLSLESVLQNIDKRLQIRYWLIMAVTLENPGESSICAITDGNTAAMAAYYRFIGNKKITYQILIKSHIENTIRRTRTQKIVLCIADTCVINLTNLVKCTGLGYLGTKISESENNNDQFNDQIIEIYQDKFVDKYCFKNENIFEDEYVEEYLQLEFCEDDDYNESKNITNALNLMSPYVKNLMEREKGASYGIFSHSILAVTLDGIGLGMLRLELTNPQKLTEEEKRNRNKQSIEEKKSHYWIDDLKCVQKVAEENPDTLYVLDGDREMDFYQFHENADNLKNVKYVGRVKDLKNTRVEVDGKIYTGENFLEIASEKGTVERKIERKSSRPGIGREERREKSDERIAKFSIRAFEGDRLPPKSGEFKDGRKIRTNFVIAVETNPKPGEEPIVWYLETNLPASTLDECLLVVDIYVKRWNIEVKHRNDKNTFDIDQINCDDVEKVKNAITIRLIVSWYTMFINRLSRVYKNTDANVIFDNRAKNELAQILGIPPQIDSEPHITLYDAVRCVSKLAGYTDRRCDSHPGDQLFGKGLKELFIRIKAGEEKIAKFSNVIDQLSFITDQQKEGVKAAIEMLC